MYPASKSKLNLIRFKMETRKILMVTTFYPPYHVGGACTHVYYLANELAKRGHEVHVLYSKDAYYLKRNHKPNRQEYTNHENVHLHEISTPIGKISPVYSFVSGLMPFKEEAMKVFNESYDLIHYHNISLLGPKVLSYGNANKIYTAHDHWLVCPLSDFFTEGAMCNKNIAPATCSLCLLKNNRPIQLWRHSDLLKKSLKEIQLVISPSEYLRNFLVKNSINLPIKVLPNFVPRPPQKIDDNGLSLHYNYFFYAGMLEERKGIVNLLNAFKDCKDRKLVIAGKGSLEKFTKRFIEINKLEKNIIYVDWIEGKKIYSYYKNALAFILPSICPENSPLTILEALSTGTPSIGSSIGGIPEIISKVDRKLIFNCNDVEELKENIYNFDKSRYKPEELKKIYNEHYAPEAYIDNYLKLINELPELRKVTLG